MSAFTRKEVDALGRRLRDSEPPASDDLRRYFEYAREYEPALLAVLTALEDIAAETLPTSFRSVSSRIKATDSVLGKLRRKVTTLAQMQDIAGCRLTVPDLDDLWHMSRHLRETLDVIRVKDYNVDSKAGYRALHLIVRQDQMLVEVQLRTEVQHAWANMSETLAYEHDRLIKAGGGPADLRMQLLQLSEQGHHVDVTREALQAALLRHFEFLDFLQDWESTDSVRHLRAEDVEAVLSLLGVAQYTHQRLVDGILWRLEAFEYAPPTTDNA